MYNAKKNVIRLLLLGCSKQKSSRQELLPALDRYDGPAFCVVKRYLQISEAISPKPRIVILSAKFGLIEVSQPIPFYDQQMNDTLEERLAKDAGNKLYNIFESEGNKILEVRLQMSKSYLEAIYQAYPPIKTYPFINIATGTPGQRLTGLHRWLYQNETLLQNETSIATDLPAILATSTDQLNTILKLWLDQPQPKVGFWAVIVNGRAVGAKWLCRLSSNGFGSQKSDESGLACLSGHPRKLKNLFRQRCLLFSQTWRGNPSR